MATFTVTTTADSGAGSLRQAVLDANAAAGEDSIVFDAAFDGGAEDLIRLTGGQIVVTGRLNIYGGASQVTITGDAAGDDVTDAAGITDVAASGAGRLDDNSRIFDASAALKLDGLILTGGRTTGEGENGGAVRTAANLTLIDSTVSGNSTTGFLAVGGGIYSETRIKLFGSTVSGNNSGSSGGGIYGGRVTATNSTVSGNNSDGLGGGIRGQYVTVTNSTVSGNNSVELGGGGIHGNYTTVSNSTVSGNSAGGPGGGIGGYHVTVSNSTISGNRAVGDYAQGGGIEANYATVRNSTVSGNSAGGEGGGIWYFSFSEYYSPNGLDLTNSIVLGNTSISAGYAEIGGGGPVELAGGNIVGGDVFHGGTEIGRTSAAQVFKATDTIDGGVLAGRLADNGGPTETIALRFDVTNPALGGGFAPYAPAFDQRGVVRDAAPDLGAFESGPVDGLVLAGTAKADTLTGSALRDQIYGRNGNDLLRGLAGGDQLRGEAGADRLGGGAGRDGLDGGTGRDWLKGGPGSDWLHGGDGADTLDGGGGDDLLSGGRGADLFVFAGSFGQDRIARFDADPAGGQDLIDLRAFAIPPGLFDDRVVVTDLGDDTRITVIGHGEILCPGVSGDGANAIDATDFLL